MTLYRLTVDLPSGTTEAEMHKVKNAVEHAIGAACVEVDETEEGANDEQSVTGWVITIAGTRDASVYPLDEFREAAARFAALATEWADAHDETMLVDGPRYRAVREFLTSLPRNSAGGTPEFTLETTDREDQPVSLSLEWHQELTNKKGAHLEDPNETLRQLRLTIKQMRVDEHPDIKQAHANEIAEYVEALDEYLSGGGRLPTAWQS